MGVFVDVTGLRRIGKTYELTRFAHERDYILIVPTSLEVERIKKEFSGSNVLAANSLLRGLSRPVVVDEHVDIDKLIEQGVEIVTGYISNYSL